MTGGRPPRFVYDAWRVLDEERLTSAGVVYAGLGYRAPASDLTVPEAVGA